MQNMTGGDNVRYKGCTRCRGNVYRSQDRYGEFDVCVQCAMTADVPMERATATAPPLQGSAQSASAAAA